MKIADIIKYEGNNDVFVWKHPIEDFNTTTQLIVHESQEAIFFSNGQALDLFGPGRYILNTQNLPLLRRLTSIPTDGQTPFHCEVYFINKTMPLDMKWGTNSQIVVQDPKFNILLHAGANGGMGIQIADSRKFLVKFVGTVNSFDKDTVSSYFRELIVMRIKTYLTNIMTHVSFVTVNAKLDEMSSAMFEALSGEMSEFGVKLIKFFVSAIQLAKDDYERIQTALSEASAIGIAATAEKGRMETLGYNWADQEVAQIMKTYAANEGGQSGIGGMVAQVPMAMLFGQLLKDNTSPMMESLFSAKPQNFGENPLANKMSDGLAYCSSCGRKLNADVKFCPGCGKPIANIQGDRCKNCGRLLKEDEHFCPNCGTQKGE